MEFKSIFEVVCFLFLHDKDRSQSPFQIHNLQRFSNQSNKARETYIHYDVHLSFVSSTSVSGALNGFTIDVNANLTIDSGAVMLRGPYSQAYKPIKAFTLLIIGYELLDFVNYMSFRGLIYLSVLF